MGEPDDCTAEEWWAHFWVVLEMNDIRKLPRDAHALAYAGYMAGVEEPDEVVTSLPAFWEDFDNE
jgi:hypothetical protein